MADPDPTAAQAAAAPGAPTPPALDPVSVMRSRAFVALLVFAAVIGVGVSLASWGFLELVHAIQVLVFTDLPEGLGFDTAPWWWPLPVLGLAGLIVAFAVVKLPGEGGHLPAEGLKTGTTEPAMIPGVALAALATLGLGLVLGPEAPLIALGGALALYAVRLAKRDVPPQALMVLAAAGSFAAISVIFGSPLVAAVLIIEATGLGGPTLPLILVPGLLAAGVGSLMFTGMASWTGLSTSVYALPPLAVPSFPRPTPADIGWTILLALAAAVVTLPIRRLGLATAGVVTRRPFVLVPVAGLAVAAVAIAFSEITDKGLDEVLFSGQEALPSLVSSAESWSMGALALLVLCKSVAWGISLGGFRGGPTFPALFIGAAGGILASHLPGFNETAAIAVGMAAMAVAMLKLPLSSMVIAVTLTATSGQGATPLIIIGVIVAFLATLALEGRLATSNLVPWGRNGAPPDHAG